MIIFKEHTKQGYASRTRENIILSDITIAMAQDFKTFGEILTYKTCKEMYKPICRINLNDSSVSEERIGMLRERLLKIGKNKITINIAGNGIYSLPNYTQEKIDYFAFSLLNRLFYGWDEFNKDEVEFRCGGQSGVDEAGAIAAFKLGFESLVLAPKTWMFRGLDGKDIRNEELFKERFL